MPEKTLSKFSVFMMLFTFYGTLFVAIFNYTLNVIGAIYIVNDLGGGDLTVVYSISFFALGNAVGIPLGGYLMARWGLRRPLMTCTLLLALISFENGFATTYYGFLNGRFLQGLVCGPFYTMLLSLIPVVFPKEHRKLILPLNGSIFVVTPVLGACWGGWISYEWDWRIVFYFDTPLVFLFLMLQYFFVRDLDDLVKKPNVKLDFIGLISFACAVIPFGIFIIRGHELDWFRSPMLTWMFVVAVISFIFFVIWELDTEQPIVNIRLLCNIPFLFSLLHLAILFALYFGNIILLALWLKFWANYTSMWINLLLFNVAIAALALMFLRVYLVSLDSRIFWTLAIVFLATSSYYTTYFNVDIDFERIAISRLLAGLGLAFFLPPIFRTALGIYPNNTVDVISFLQIFRSLGSGLGAAVMNTIWERRQIFFNERLVYRLTPAAPETDDYFARVEVYGLKGQAAIEQLGYFSQREASSLALNDSFFLMFWLLLVMLLSFIPTIFWPKKIFNP